MIDTKLKGLLLERDPSMKEENETALSLIRQTHSHSIEASRALQDQGSKMGKGTYKWDLIHAQELSMPINGPHMLIKVLEGVLMEEVAIGHPTAMPILINPSDQSQLVVKDPTWDHRRGMMRDLTGLGKGFLRERTTS